MPSQKISQMTSATTLNDLNVVPIVQDDVNKKTTLQLLREYIYTFGTEGILLGGPAGPIQWFGLSQPFAGQLAAVVFLAETLQADVAMRLTYMPDNRIPHIGSLGNVISTPGLEEFGGGGVRCNGLEVNGSIAGGGGAFSVNGGGDLTCNSANIGGGNCTIDNAGNVNANEVHASNGVNFSGAPTNITVVDGIVTAAS